MKKSLPHSVLSVNENSEKHLSTGNAFVSLVREDTVCPTFYKLTDHNERERMRPRYGLLVNF